MNPFDYSLSFNNRIIIHNIETTPLGDLIEKILGSYRVDNTDKIRLAVNCILSNLLIAYLNGYYLAVSRSKNDYSGNSFYGLNHSTYRIIISLIEYLISEGLVNQALGYYIKVKDGRRTRIWITDKLLSIFNATSSAEIDFSTLNYTRSILLKDKDKRLIKYRCSKKISSMLQILNEYNEFMSGCEILFPYSPDSIITNKKLLSPFPLQLHLNLSHMLSAELLLSNYKPATTPSIPLLIPKEYKSLYLKRLEGQLYRVFNNASFCRGGRFYGGSYQQLNEIDRAKITINGSPVVEVDYSALHLNMLYHLSNKQFDADPYAVVDRPEVRPILKVLCLIIINSKDKSQALRAFRYEIRRNYEFQKLKKIYHLDEKDLLRKFESVHSGISNYFCSGIGLRLQYKDSQLAESILKYFIKRKIPCLCVHDSFLVPAEHKDELEEVMIINYRKHFGFVPKIK